MGSRCVHTSIFIETPSLEGLQIKAKEDSSTHETRLSSAEHQPSINQGKVLLLLSSLLLLLLLSLLLLSLFLLKSWRVVMLWGFRFHLLAFKLSHKEVLLLTCGRLLPTHFCLQPFFYKDSVSLLLASISMFRFPVSSSMHFCNYFWLQKHSLYVVCLERQKFIFEVFML